MRIAILADVHSNLPALRAVLDHAETHHLLDALWILGDIVGYGPHPNECIDLLRRYPQETVIGNHDLAALGRIDTSTFNLMAQAAAAWTAQALTDESREYLASLPEVRRLDTWTLVHGTLRAPVIEYLYDEEAAFAHLSLQATPWSAVGHTHIPAVARLDPRTEAPPELIFLEDGAVIPSDDVGRAVVNPGGVGQPRDGDPRAAYALYDVSASHVTFHRVPYDIAATQRAMEEAQLPRPLIDRLAYGR